MICRSSAPGVQARIKAAVSGIDGGAPFAKGHLLGADLVALVSPAQMGRMLSSVFEHDEARRMAVNFAQLASHLGAEHPIRPLTFRGCERLHIRIGFNTVLIRSRNLAMETPNDRDNPIFDCSDCVCVRGRDRLSGAGPDACFA